MLRLAKDAPSFVISSLDFFFHPPLESFIQWIFDNSNLVYIVKKKKKKEDKKRMSKLSYPNPKDDFNELTYYAFNDLVYW